jgi:hypothetical protein
MGQAITRHGFHRAMRFLFLIGSLTVGAALAGGISQFSVAVRLALGLAAVGGFVFIFFAYKCASLATQKVAFVIDKESERYSEADVSEFLRALSEAKARSAAPFASAGASDRFSDRDS